MRKKPKAPAANAVASAWSVLTSDSEEEGAIRRAANSTPLTSVLTRRVPDGVVRRLQNLRGDHFIELKLYKVEDINKVAPLDRWEKAIVNLKLQIDGNAAEVTLINKFLKLCKERFTAEGTFYSDKKRIFNKM